ncbi:class I SAM-dependent methyltransferase [Algivirga pacifica]|uniref:Class I SAM-dependent methyltransferase n=1 Tax=Algivirga pacifica TaxID=1162670 RepID=A0ABP9D2W5_9BACT
MDNSDKRKAAESRYLEINRKLWNDKTTHHLTSDFYRQEHFLKGENSLKQIELDLLGDLKGKEVLHLQCHFGQDSLSMARMGAKVTGVDLSDKAIETAKGLAEELSLDADFICCDLYTLPEHLNKQFDIVFASYGTIGWLPDMDRWAAIVQQYLKPGGQFVFVEFHPVVWMFDDHFKNVDYRYFKSEPIVELTEGTYADPDAPISNNSVSWNHSLSEVIGSLLKQGLQLKHFEEFDYSPYDCFAHTEQVGESQYRIKHHGDKLPMTYSLLMEK